MEWEKIRIGIRVGEYLLRLGLVSSKHTLTKFENLRMQFVYFCRQKLDVFFLFTTRVYIVRRRYQSGRRFVKIRSRLIKAYTHKV